MSTPTRPTTDAAATDQIGVVADVIATAFHRLAVSKWLVADPEERFAAQRGQFGIIVEHAAEHGRIYLDADHRAAAVWLDYTQPIPEPADYDRRLFDLCGPHTPRFAALDVAFEENHPRVAHQHLAFMAVLPEYQEQGLGSELVAAHHEVLDREGTPAYLEAANLRVARMYGKWGYRIISRIDLPGGPSMWPMWRDPSAAGEGRR
ncbi:GNAT family N-acetyltransferase [Ruania zhangjianzhongii]|uniref:GNAT family N-acetyltransferase n=1 Tax=Ruania zhangjianzhongii TaxID=2603206 RepID=UPI0011CB551C|nr:GNAT family N-acetyltransferase [Ruania zhangjianzhongii]